MNSVLRVIFLIYFITHIPITIVLDLQVAFGDYYPASLKSIPIWYTTTYNDNLIRTRPIWLQSFIWAEAFLQMPFFFVAIYALIYKKNWIRVPSIIYGSHVATTVIPLLSEFVFTEGINTVKEKATLFAFYFPYLLIPLLLAGYMSIHEVPFKNSGSKKLI